MDCDAKPRYLGARRLSLSWDHVKRTDKINGRNVRARRNHTAGVACSPWSVLST